jgi:hypothetical protein
VKDTVGSSPNKRNMRKVNKVRQDPTIPKFTLEKLGPGWTEPEPEKFNMMKTIPRLERTTERPVSNKK